MLTIFFREKVLRFFLFITCILYIIFSYDQASATERAKIRFKKYSSVVNRGNSKAPYYTLGLSSGAILFKDIQFPAYNEDMRADGSCNLPEKDEKHFSLPVILNFSILGSKKNRFKIRYHMDFEIMYASALSGSKESLESSYSRLGLMFGFRKSIFSKRLEFGGYLQIRRAAYMNVSSGHMVESVSPRYLVKIKVNRKLKVEAFFSHSIESRFGLSRSVFSSNRQLKNSSSSGMDMGFHARYLMGDKTYLLLGVERDRADISIDALGDYEKLGFRVAEDLKNSSREIELSTDIFRVGVQRVW